MKYDGTSIEKMPSMRWRSENDYSTGLTDYTLIVKGLDRDRRNYFYTCKVSKITDCSKLPAKTTYSAEYSLFTDGNNFKLKPVKDNKSGFRSLISAKRWVEDACRAQWAKDHERRTA